MTDGTATSCLPKSSPELPKWARVLALIAGWAIILGALGGALGISWARRLVLDAIDPVYIAGTLKQIGDFPDTAVSGFHPVLALRLPALAGAWQDFAGVFFNEGKGKLQFDLATYKSEDTDPDPKEVIDYFYELPAVFSNLTARFESIVDKGKVDVNGHELIYQIVLLENLQDTKGPLETNDATETKEAKETNRTKGATGAKGPNGATAATGAKDPNGTTAATGAKDPNGATGVTGAKDPNGTTAATGAKDPNGATGVTGAKDPNGAIDATGAKDATDSKDGKAGLSNGKVPTYKGMIGCMTIGRKVIVVESAAPAEKGLDINVVIDFLRKAHSF